MTPAACAACSARQICGGDAAARARRRAGPRVDQLAELDALEVLHHEVEGAVGGGAGVGDVDDVRVADPRRRARLAPEALDQVGLWCKLGCRTLIATRWPISTCSAS